MSVQFGDTLILPRSDESHLTEWRRSVDWQIMIAALSLLGLGLMLSLAAGPPAAERLGLDDAFYFVKRHSVFAVAAAVGLVAASMLDAVWARRISAVVFCGSFVMLTAILIIGHEAKGAHRWIEIGGFTLQPSEFAKPALIVLSGWLLAQRQLFPGGPWAVMTGPEGGFSESELDGMAKLPFVTAVRLGPRILRADTAAAAVLVCWQNHLGDWSE